MGTYCGPAVYTEQAGHQVDTELSQRYISFSKPLPVWRADVSFAFVENVTAFTYLYWVFLLRGEEPGQDIGQGDAVHLASLRIPKSALIRALG